MIKKFEGVTSDGDPTPNPMTGDEYLDFNKARYFYIDEKRGQVDEVSYALTDECAEWMNASMGPIGGTKHDNGKPDLSLLPAVLLRETAKTYMFGEHRYGRFNFERGFETHRLVAACLRHVVAWNEGEDNDPESGVSHLAHAAATLGMLLRCLELGTATDTRSKRNRPAG